jgi:hypothetical protein
MFVGPWMLGNLLAAAGLVFLAWRLSGRIRG